MSESWSVGLRECLNQNHKGHCLLAPLSTEEGFSTLAFQDAKLRDHGGMNECWREVLCAPKVKGRCERDPGVQGLPSLPNWGTPLAIRSPQWQVSVSPLPALATPKEPVNTCS